MSNNNRINGKPIFSDSYGFSFLLPSYETRQLVFNPSKKAKKTQPPMIVSWAAILAKRECLQVFIQIT